MLVPTKEIIFAYLICKTLEFRSIEYTLFCSGTKNFVVVTACQLKILHFCSIKQKASNTHYTSKMTLTQLTLSAKYLGSTSIRPATFFTTQLEKIRLFRPMSLIRGSRGNESLRYVGKSFHSGQVRIFPDVNLVHTKHDTGTNINQNDLKSE